MTSSAHAKLVAARQKARLQGPHLDPYLLGLVVLGAVGLITQLLVTRWGIGLSPDSATYIAGARGLLQGHGYAFPNGGGDWQPTTLWPPFYSAVLAVPGLLGVDPLEGARWLNGLLYGANAILVGLLVRRASGKRSIVPFIGAFLFLLLDDTMSIHGWAWSEPLSVFAGFLGLLFLDRHLHSRRRGDLVSAAVLTGLSCLTRYAGLAFVACGLVVLAVFYARRRTITKGLEALAIFGGVALIGLAAWAIRNWLLTGIAGGSQLSSRPISPEDWKDAFHIVSLWFLPGRIEEPFRGWILSGMGVAVVLLVLPVLRERPGATDLPARPNSVVPILLTFLPIYSLVILGSKAYVRPLELDDPRHYVPVYVGLLVVILVQLRGFVLGILASLARQNRPRLRMAVQVLAGIVFASLVAYHGTHTWKWARESLSEGLGYANESWHTSTLLAYVRGLPPKVPVFSNAYDAVYVLTGREAYPLPGGLELNTEIRGGDLPPEWLRMAQLMEEEGAKIAYFRESTRRGMADERTLRDVLPICILLEAPEGRAFAWCAQN